MSETSGKFITFEGIEGCGKSTQHTLLCDFLSQRQIEVVKTREPGGTEIGGEIRKILLHPKHHIMVPACETLLYLADRAQHVAQKVRPALKRGDWVLSDRYHDSTRAYQGAARGMPRESLNMLYEVATSGLKPDLTLLLDLEPEQGLARALARNEDHNLVDTEGRFEAESLPFHRAVRNEFLAQAAEEPTRFAVIDAALSPEAVFDQVQAVLARREWYAHV